MVKITMGLTEQDVDNIEEIARATRAPSKAQAVSTALALTRFIIRRLEQDPGTKVLLRDSDGKYQRLVMKELEQVAKDLAAGRT